jgi:predicted glycosyltransferase
MNIALLRCPSSRSIPTTILRRIDMLPSEISRRSEPQLRSGFRRVAFYSHDTVGLGHTRRNLALAAALVSAGEATDVLVLTGNPEAGALPLPPHTDVVTLPTISKDQAGNYRSRVLHSPLSVVVNIRSKVIEAALTAFEPDLLIVDKVPLGVGNELEPSLARLVRTGRTHIVLGLREILDDPVSAVREWEAMGTTQAIADFYDAVWVYGDQAVYDPVVEYGLPAVVADKVSYTGYLSHGRAAADAAPRSGACPPPDEPYVLCLVGGGQDGFGLAETFVRTALPPGHRGVVLAGPFMTPEARQQLAEAAGDSAVTIHAFVPNADDFLAGAAAVVSMAGYNSACEILATPTPALFVPRTRPRTEQLIRATRLAELGLADLIELDRLDPALLGRWLAGAVTTSPHAANRASSAVDLGGLQAVSGLVEQLVDGLTHAA